MGRPLFSPAVCADASDEAAAPREQTDVCPKCGGALRFESDRLGYGQTIEQCEHVVKCGYWRTLEKIVRPALRRAPTTDEKRPARRTPRSTGPRKQTRVVLEALIERVPRDPAAALVPIEFARVAQLSQANAVRYLQLLHGEGRVARKKRRVPGKSGKPAYEYWRAA